MKICFLYTPKQPVSKCQYNANVGESFSNIQLLPHLGIAYLAALLRDKGYEVSLIEANALNLNKEHIIKKLFMLKPDYVLYTCITDILQDTLSWIREIKKEYNKQVIVGGPHMGIYPKETLTHECIDYGVVGDGWETLPELLDALKHKRNLTNVKGIVYREHGRIVLTEARSTTVNLEDVPLPARDLLPNEKYNLATSRAKPITVMITALGCPFKCSYCASGKYLRLRPVEHIVAEVEECINKYGIREIEFYDETFTLNKNKMKLFLDLIEEKNLKFYWTVRTRVDRVDKELLSRMARNGCIRINFGIESGDEDVLKAINRKASLVNIRNTVRWTKETGISTFGFFMIGMPQDTKESIEKTLKFMLELDLDFMQLTKFTLFPNTEMYEDYKRKTGNDFWRDYTLEKTTLDHFKRDYSNITEEELDKYFERAYRMFYFRPKFIWQKLLALKSFSEFKRLASGALVLLKH